MADRRRDCLSWFAQRDLPEPYAGDLTEENRIVGSPTGAERALRREDRERRTAADIDPLQLAILEISDPLAGQERRRSLPTPATDLCVPVPFQCGE
jgi:hypothetical protein